MRGNYLTFYARKDFIIDNPAAVTKMILSLVCDGPFIAYLNGIEVFRTNTVQISDTGQSIGRPVLEPIDISGFAHELLPGGNVLAIQCDNDDIASGDYSFIPLFEVFGK